MITRNLLLPITSSSLRGTKQFTVIKRFLFLMVMLCVGSSLYAQDPDYSGKVSGGPEGGIVGKIDGDFTVTPLGQVNYEIPILTVPGTGGISPKLSITYNSSTKNGLFGYGFDLTGLSIISRVPQNIFNDGKPGVVSLSSTDKFALDGARLMDVKTINATTYPYATESNNFSKIIAYGDKVNPTSFIVQTKDGLTYEYRPSYEVVNSIPGEFNSPYERKALIWVLTKVTDTKGNYFTVSYQDDANNSHDVYPSRIDYTGNANAGITPYASVRFTYAADQYSPKTYVGGIGVTRKEYITQVGIYFGERVQKYFDFSYNRVNYKNELASIAERSPYSSSLGHSIRFNWTNVANYNVTNIDHSTVDYSTTNPINKATLTIGDFNGDGKSDFIATPENKDAGWTGWKLFISNGKSFNHVKDGNFDGDDFDDTSVTPQIATGDFNGDGYDDIAVLRKDKNGYYYTWLYTASVTGSTVTFKGAACVLMEKRQYSIHTVETNGDGIAELFVYYTNSKEGKILYGGASNPLSTTIAHNSIANWDRTDFVDFNGDGLTDIINIVGGSFELNGAYNTAFNKGSNPLFGDFNGDGKTDVLLTNAASGSNNGVWSILMANGAGGFNTVTIPSKFDISKKQIFVMDINGDGFDDFYAIDKTSPANTGTVPSVYLNDGTGNTYNQVGSDGTYALDRWHFYMGDFNGDGKMDFLCTADWKNATWNGYQLFLMPEDNNGLITKIMDGFGNETKITYKYLTDPTVFQRGTTNAYPVASVGLSWPVVYQVQTPNGVPGVTNITTYTYKNALMHKRGRGFLGFEYFIAKDETSGITTTSQFEVEPTKYLIAVKHTDSKFGSRVLSQTDIQNVVLNSPLATTVFSYVPTTTTEKTYEYNTGALLTDVTTTNTYDSYGNVTKSVSASGGITTTTTTTTTVNTYINDESRWILGRLTDAVVTKTGASGSQVRHAKFEYDAASGLLTTEYTEPDNTELGYKKTYAHDVFGNITQSTTTPLNGSSTRQETTTYSPEGRFIMNETNSLGYTTTNTVDRDRALMLSSKNPNGVITNNTYDGFGRLISSSTPITTTKTTIGWSAGMVDAPNTALYFKYVTTTGRPYALEFFDCVGRSVRKVTESVNGRKIYVDAVYNAKGQVDKTSEPYFMGGTIYWNQNTYDDVGRVIKQTDANGNSYTIQYNGLSTTTTDPLGHSATKTIDMNGNLVSSTDTEGNSVNYTYNVDGKCVEIQGPRTTVNMDYDLMGNRILLDDPDLGVSRSKYNAYGELISNTDSKGTTTYAYDGLGRLVTETRPDVTITTLYDINCIGEIAFIYSSNGTAIEYDSDQYGRLISETTDSNDGKYFRTSYSYNAQNQVDVTYYPTGLTVKNEYDNGILYSVKNNSTGEQYWLLGEINARGQVEQEDMGDGLTTFTTYNPGKGYITGISTQGVQNWSYAFDAVGNLTSRKDNSRHLTETFGYDDLYRLTKVSKDGVVTQDMTYDAAGNIMAKTGVLLSCSYTDGTNRISSVEEMGKSGIKSWDKITYTSFNKVNYVAMGNSSLTLTYGPDKSRFIAVEKDSEGATETKYYAGNFYEQVVNGDEFTDVCYIFADGKAVAIIETSSKTGTKTRYLYHDQLGSIIAYTENGKLAQELSYDAWGRRRNPDTWGYYSDTADANAWQDRGFEGHEHLDLFDMVNMDGRMYDPVLGRFLSPDPLVQAPDNPQSLNRYAYCMNNPLSLIDPSGYSWFSRNWKSLFSAVVGIVVSAVTAGTASGIGIAIIAGAAVALPGR